MFTADYTPPGPQHTVAKESSKPTGQDITKSTATKRPLFQEKAAGAKKNKKE